MTMFGQVFYLINCDVLLGETDSCSARRGGSDRERLKATLHEASNLYKIIVPALYCLPLLATRHYTCDLTSLATCKFMALRPMSLSFQYAKMQ